MSVVGKLEAALSIDTSQVPRAVGDAIKSIATLPSTSSAMLDVLDLRFDKIARSIRAAGDEMERVRTLSASALQAHAGSTIDTSRIQIASVRQRMFDDLSNTPLGDEAGASAIRLAAEEKIAEITMRAGREALSVEKERALLNVRRAEDAENIARIERDALKTKVFALNESLAPGDRESAAKLSAIQTKLRDANSALSAAELNTQAARKAAENEIAELKLREVALEKEMTSASAERLMLEKKAAAERAGAAEADALSKQDAKKLLKSTHRMTGALVGMQMAGGMGDQMDPGSVAKLTGTAMLMSGNPYAMLAGGLIAGGAEAWHQWNLESEEAKAHLVEVEKASAKVARELRELRFPDDLTVKLERSLKLLREQTTAARSYNDAITEGVRLSRDAQGSGMQQRQRADTARLAQQEAAALAALRPGDDRGAERVKHDFAQRRIALEQKNRAEELNHAALVRSDEMSAAMSNEKLAADHLASVRALADAAHGARNEAESRTLGRKKQLRESGIAYMDDPELTRLTAKQIEADKADKEAKDALTDATQRHAEAEQHVLALKSAQKDVDAATEAQKRADAANAEAEAAQETLRHKQAQDAMRTNYHMPVDAMARVGLFINGRGAATADHNRDIANHTRDAAASLRRIEDNIRQSQPATYGE